MILSFTFICNVQAATRTASVSGNWNNIATWGGPPAAVPVAGDDVVINGGVTVTIDTDVPALSSLAVSGTLQYEATTARILTVAGIVTINSGGVFLSAPPSSTSVITTHSLVVDGSIINNGTINFSVAAGAGGTTANASGAGITFKGASPATFNFSTATLTNLRHNNGIVLNKGTSASSVLTFSPGGTFQVESGNTDGFLTINNGTFKIIGTNAFSNPVFELLSYVIPGSGGFELSNPNAVVVGQNGSVDNNGILRISSGIYNIGSSLGNSSVTNNGGTFELTGGEMNVAGRFLLSNATGTFSGGSLNISTVGHSSSTQASFECSITSNLAISGSTQITIIQPNSSATPSNDIEIFAGGSKTITGGTIQLGNGSIPLGRTFRVNSDIPLNNLTIGSNASVILADNLTINNDLVVNGELQVNSNDLVLRKFLPDVVMNFTGGIFNAGATINVTPTNGKHPQNKNTTNYLNHYWTITTSNITNPVVDVTLTYSEPDVVGSDSKIITGVYKPDSKWYKYSPAATALNNLLASGINNTSFSITGITSDPPTVTVTASPAIICAGSSSNLTATPVGDSPFSYLWTPVTGLSSSTIANPVATPLVTTSYTLTVTDGNGFTANASQTITVNALPIAAATPASQTYCNGVLTTAIALTGTPSGVVFDVTGGTAVGLADQTGVTSIPAFTPIAGTATITITPKANGCTGTPVTYSITVNPTPTATAPANQTYCNGVLTTAIALTGAPSGVVFDVTGGTAVGLADQTGVTSIPAFTPIAGTATITITPKANGCTGTPVTYSITVNPTPTATAPANQTYCNGVLTTAIALTGAPSGVVFDVTGGVTVGLANQTGVTSIPAFTPIAGTATITITPKANGCTGTPVTYSITVNPTPTATAPANQTYCNGVLTTAIALTGAPSGVVFDVTGGIAVGLANQTGVTSIPAFTPIAGTATITITPKANGCTGTPVTYSITVNPTPTATAPPDQGYCNGDLTSIIPLVGTPSGVVFDITGGAAVGLNNKTGVTQIASFTAKTGTATVTITPRANGCTGTAVTFVITVSPTPTVSSSPAAQTICSDGTTNITLTSTTPGATLSWTVGTISPAGSIAGAANGSGSSGVKIAQTLTNSTANNATVTFVVTPTAGGCSGIPMNVVVTVKPSPVLAITNPAPACTPTSVDLTAAAIIAGSTAGLNYTYWTDAAATIALSSPNAITTSGTYYIKGTDPVSGGCFIVKPVTVSVEPTPSLTITNPAPVCAPSTVDITSPAITAGSTPGLVLTYWVDAAATIPLANPNAVDDDTYYIKGIASGCYDIQPVVVSVYSTLGIPVFTLGASSSTCRGTSPNTYTASATNSLGITYSLDATSLAAGNTINTTSGLVTFAPGWSGTSQITATATGCGAPTQAIHSVIVNIPPTVSLTANPAIPFCEGTPVTLTATSSGGSTFITNSGSSGNINVTIPESRASWAGSTIPITGFGTSTISATDIIEVSLNITHGDNDQLDIFLVDPSGTKAMLLSTDNGGNGNNYTNATLRTNYTPNINTLAGVNTSNIAGLFGAENNATVVASQTGGNGGNYGNAAVPQSSLLGATINGNWQIRVFDDNNSGGLGTLVNWSLSITKQAGSPFTTVFNGPGTIGPITYSGAFNSTASAVVTPPAGTITYTATTTDSNGCPGTSNTVTVVVNPNPNPTINADYCSIPGKIRLTASGGGTYKWNTGETTSYIDINIAGSYSVLVTSAFGCTGTASIGASTEQVTNPDFSAGYSGFTSEYTPHPAYWNQPTNVWTPSGLHPEGLYAVNTNAWTNYPLAPQGYHPNFHGRDHTTGNGNFMMVNGSVDSILISPGVYRKKIIWQQNVTVTANTHYYFSAWAMNLNPVSPARLQFEINGVRTGSIAELSLAPKPASEADVSTTNWIQFYNPNWDSGSLSGTVTIRIINLNTIAGGNDFGLDDISFATLDPLPPSVAPTVNGSTSSTFCQFEPIYLVANVSNGKPPFTYLWTGPNGFISTERDPIILNASAAIAGNYTLTLTDGYGCLPSPTGTVSVTIAPAATVNAGVDQDVCASNPTITLAGVIGGSATSGTWSGGTGTFNPNANTLNAVYTPSAAEIAAGTVTLTLTSNDPAGVCNAVSDQMTTTIFSPTVNATSSAAVGPLCHGGSDGYATIIATGGIGPYTYLWNTTPAQTTATATNLTAGTYIVRVTDIHGCFADQTIILTEPPALVVDDTPIVIEPTCFGLNNGSAEINVLSGVSPTFLWSNGQTTNPAINLTAGNYTVTITSANGCEATSMLVVVTQPDFLTAPVVRSITQPTCTVGTGTVVFDGLPTGNWTINPGAISGSTNNTTISGLSSGTYNFTVTNSAGCVSSPTAVTIDAIPPTPSCNITGTASVFSGSSYTYTSTPVPGDNVIHSWSISGNGTITGSTTNATVDVTAGAAGTFTVTDNITRLGCTNSCTYDVTVISPCSISPITGSVPNGTSTTYTAPAGMDTYSWSISGNGSIPSGITNQQTVSVLAGNACTTYTISLSMVKNGVTIPSCTQTVNVTDNQPPTFTTVNTLSYCVESIQNAVYNSNPTAGILPEYDDLTTPRPEYYRLTAASKLLDLDPVINNFNDNCCSNNSLIIHWEILFAPTPNPASAAHEPITKPPILGQTGQPSAYGDILFPGDGVTFTNIIHQINYWLEDCNGNPASNPVIHSVNIIIKPRPNIIKMN